jgi:hypothetical protein
MKKKLTHLKLTESHLGYFLVQIWSDSESPIAVFSQIVLT